MTGILKDISALTLYKFAGYTLLIILGKFVLNAAFVYAANKNPKLRDRFVPAASALLNWLAFYGVVLTFLFTFSKKKWLFYPLYSRGGVDVSLFLIIVAVMAVSLASRLVKLLTKYVLTRVYHHYDVDKGLGSTFNQVIYYIVMIIAIWISFRSVGIDLTALGAIFGVLGIGIGFGMRNIAGNFVSGIIMLFERPVEVGEFIQINDTVGKVEKIRLRSTVVWSPVEGSLIVPNQYFIEQIIKNRTGAQVMAQVTISVEYGADTEEVDRLLRMAVQTVKDRYEGILNNPQPNVHFVDFRYKAMDFQVDIPVINFDVKDQVESRLRHVIAKLFTENKIQLAAFEAAPVEK